MILALYIIIGLFYLVGIIWLLRQVIKILTGALDRLLDWGEKEKDIIWEFKNRNKIE